MWRILLIVMISVILMTAVSTGAEPPLRVATFQIDATPPLGSPLCGGAVEPAAKIVDRLSARGLILLTDRQPIVLCSVDWVGIGAAGHDAWRAALARAAGTSVQSVAVHTVHQHDAPGCDFAAESLLASRGLGGAMFHVAFAQETIRAAAAAVTEALDKARTVTHVGLGRAKVDRVASNRRVLGEDGRVQYVRYSSCRIPEARAAPEGVIDPDVRLISFWGGDRPLVSLTYYATHPQSYYGQGGVSADFVGMARATREADLPGVAHIHFNGASGNVAAGKYNDGSPEVRPVLARRLAEGMKQAWDNTKKQPVAVSDVRWRVEPVQLPPRETLVEHELLAVLDNQKESLGARIRAARDLVWLRRCQSRRPVELSCLEIGPARVLHMPGELFVEYQLAAQQMRGERFVTMAAYGDYAPGYIGTQVAYSQGGYETGPVSRTAPEVEAVLMSAMRKLLNGRIGEE